MSKSRYAQRIVMFFCRPCAEYHFKTHPHYRAMKRRAIKRKKTKGLMTIETPMSNRQFRPEQN
jgi:hypothetical protein